MTTKPKTAKKVVKRERCPECHKLSVGPWKYGTGQNNTTMLRKCSTPKCGYVYSMLVDPIGV